jgi:SAM-dependent methyltransferase
MPTGFSESFLKELVSYAVNSAPKSSGHTLLRYAMYKALGNVISDRDAPDHKCLTISSSIRLAKVCGLNSAKFTEANYPEVSMTELPFTDNEFDSCVSDQVLEHIEGDPFKAFRESVRVVKPGGVVVHTTCLINPVHGSPSDFWRFTLDGLRLLAKDANTKVLVCDGWGNWDAWRLVKLGIRFIGLPADPDHPITKLATKNEPAVPISVWIVAEKPS